jgi:hypothetical protein
VWVILHKQCRLFDSAYAPFCDFQLDILPFLGSLPCRPTQMAANRHVSGLVVMIIFASSARGACCTA